METDQYLDMFLDESREHLQAVNDHILELEKQPDNIDLVNEIFRSAHTLKGMAATMGFEDIASLTHKMENVLDGIRNYKLNVTTEVIDVIFVAIEYLENMVDSIAAGNDGKKDVTDLVARLDMIEKGKSIKNEGVQEVAATLEAGTPTELQLDQFQLEIVQQAKELGINAYQLTVSLEDECILKGARAYMVFDVMEKNGDIIKTNPAVEDIEEGNFDDSFSFVYVSSEPPENIQEQVSKVSEVKNVEIVRFVVDNNSSQQQKQTEEKVEKKGKKVADEKSEVTHHTSKTIRVNLERIDDLLNIFEEVIIDRGRLEVISEVFDNQELTDTVEHLGRVTSEMQNLILSMRMVPIEQVFNRFPRMIRGLAKELNKKINLEIIGSETELDRTVIDEIGDPLVHLIRNSIDHGIELPEVRAQAGKSEEGHLILRAYHSGNHVFIEIEDDGAGINREKVQMKAIEKGLILAEEAELLSDDEIANFILSSGFSTADQISDISGRGVGLDVVKSKMEALGGEISIKTEKGKGSIFSIQLPLTLSIIATLLVKVKHETYAIPLSSIIETVLLQDEQILSAHGRKVMDFRGQVVPLVSLSEVFEVPIREEKNEKYHAVVVVKKGEKLTGLIVDSFIGQKEVVLKSLGSYLKDVFAISGATILGDGEVALIIDPNALIK
ncbi:chemotaxis protein CheA [Oceanobacillus caeni]|uniref:chemotaxis protein CheA n=1 Tax=Oceanobacillus caeni TaxID=405946 RepID=UPI000621D02E|nr:chemotaxis protein CheA [Oceanobacillus caeni]KKE79699.1 chemotaxis protein CheA [Bacilli bacterium VT-13-104]PZD89586.1 chemotaxis protein CheA [Bacilli bacterium]MCR1833340.1 chemotaxis protein CheA [Oceanobacillus caeni]MED4474888.1 chemotaxis protein CheA [Oceanobacillus caeni]PZD91108.1 chemotaxis protein CheA [Bacilli bacterium]